MKKNKFKFSVIIPIYNVEEYLEETIESVVNQSIGFIDNIELILINDGSPDNSEEICLKYREMYPDNVIYDREENSGVSVARNKGLEFATGEFVNFLDSDDKWSINSFAEVYNKYLKNPEINIFSCKMQFFDAFNRNHPTTFKYKEDKIINILNDYNYPQLSSSSVFIKNSIIKNIRYDSKIKYSEDCKFINEIILQEESMMLLSTPVYYYRKRKSGNSAVQSKEKNIDWYTITPKLVYDYLFDLSKRKYGKVIKYIQTIVMYDLKYRIEDSPNNNVLSEKQLKDYTKILHTLLDNIDNEVILNQYNLSFDYKLKIIKEKNNLTSMNNLKYRNNSFYLNKDELYTTNNLITINVLNIEDNQVELIGNIDALFDNKDCKLIYEINNEKKDVTLLDNGNVNNWFLSKIENNKIFRISINLEDVNKIIFYLKYKMKKIILKPKFTFLGRLNENLPLHYVKNNYMAYLSNGNIVIEHKNIFKRIKFELKCMLYITKHKKYKQFIYRYTAKILKLFKRKEIWLVSDRTGSANDNGIHLFKYINSVNDAKIKSYFVISKDSPDYEKVKSIGRVLNYNSFKYKIYFLLASKIISSQADSWVINAYGKNEYYYRDMYLFDYVFLQHGIIKDDLSDWLKKINKNIRVFVTSVVAEYESVIKGKYMYSEKEVKLTGLPRYDNLSNKKKKIIAIMPTWRQNIAGPVNKELGTRNYSSEFKNTEYFKFYNNLLNDPKLLKTMKSYGYKGVFVLHPSHKENGIDFVSNEFLKVEGSLSDYQKLFSEASLLITDYSSVAFDFAYLKKPVIYSQFDKKEFFESHLYKEGYFSYENDGFGPVCYDYESTVNAIIESIENDCKNDEKYIKRIGKFFKYTDKNNSKRVYEEIKKL